MASLSCGAHGFHRKRSFGGVGGGIDTGGVSQPASTGEWHGRRLALLATAQRGQARLQRMQPSRLQSTQFCEKHAEVGRRRSLRDRADRDQLLKILWRQPRTQ